MARRIANVLFLLLVGFVLALPVLDMATDWIADPDIDENRRLAPFPPLAANKNAMRAFPPGFEAWFSDHMGLRGSLVDTYRYINQDLLDSAKNVLTGRSGWLYLLRDTVDYPERLPLPADLCGRNPFSPGELGRWRDALVNNRRAVEALGAKYFVMIVPNKQTVHGENLPPRIRCTPGERRLRQLEAALSDDSGFPLVDLQTAFISQSSAGGQLWHQTDTHWDAAGAAAGYRLLMKAVDLALDRDLPDPLAEGRVRIEPMKSTGWGLSRMLGRVSVHEEHATRLVDLDLHARSVGDALPSYGRGPTRPTERFVNEHGDLPTVLSLHDSFFGQRFKTLLAESFSRADFVWHRGEPGLDRELELIRQLKPDVVVHEMVERNLLHPYFRED